MGDVFEFKKNPDNKGKLSGLRTWINKSLKSGLSICEIIDELDHLLFQYKKSLDFHKIKYHSGILQSIIVGTAETIENVMKLKFSSIAKSFFSANITKAELLQAEIFSQGK